MHTAKPPDIWLTVKDAASLAGCCTKTVRRAVHTGRLAYQYVDSPRGPQLALTPPAVGAWLRQRDPGAPKKPSEPAAAQAPTPALSPSRAPRLQPRASDLSARMADTWSMLARSKAVKQQLRATLAAAHAAVADSTRRVAQIDAFLRGPDVPGDEDAERTIA